MSAGDPDMPASDVPSAGARTRRRSARARGAVAPRAATPLAQKAKRSPTATRSMSLSRPVRSSSPTLK